MLVDFARTPSQTPIIRGLEFFNRLGYWKLIGRMGSIEYSTSTPVRHLPPTTAPVSAYPHGSYAERYSRSILMGRIPPRGVFTLLPRTTSQSARRTIPVPGRHPRPRQPDECSRPLGVVAPPGWCQGWPA